MFVFLRRRTVQAIISLFGVTIVVFILSRSTGDPVNTLLPPDATEEEREAMRASLGLDQSYPVQYVKYLGRLVGGDLGESLRLRESNVSLIADRLPNSVILAACAMSIALVVGVTIGVFAAHRPHSRLDRGASGFALLGQSVPTFWIGILAGLVFAIHLGWFPSSDFDEGWKSLVLPALTLGWFSTAAIMRVSRSSTREALDSHFVTVARSKGLPERLILGRHALRNSFMAILTMGAIQFVLLVNGAVVTERIFNWPGIGSLLVDAAFGRDYTLVQAIVLVAAVMVIVVNLAADVVYAFVDPRVRVA